MDVSSFIRVDDDVDVLLAWRDLDGPPAADDVAPRAEEVCSVPLGDARALVADGVSAWFVDHLRSRGGARWCRADRDDLRPGMVAVVAAETGRYDPATGWDPSARGRVEPVGSGGGLLLAEAEEVFDEDPLSELGRQGGRWYGLTQHLGDVEREVGILRDGLAIDPAGLDPATLDAAALAGRLHDIGKIHPVFQATMQATAADAAEAPSGPGPWAKSGGSLQARHCRKGFRHELASALALLDAGASALGDSPEPDLVRYLVAAHHGRVRLGIRGLPTRTRPLG